jgi:hypothetical protein
MQQYYTAKDICAIEMRHNDGVKHGIGMQGREMRRNRFPAIQGLVCVFRNGFERQGKNRTEILMFAHSIDWGDSAIWGTSHGISASDFCLDIKHNNL